MTPPAVGAQMLSILLLQCSVNLANTLERPEVWAWTGDFDVAGQHGEHAATVQDDSFPNKYLLQLRSGVLNLSRRARRRAGGHGQAFQFTDAFQSAYTFHFTATSAGLNLASRSLGLPLEPFLAKATDPLCNGFFLNAVVLPVSPPVLDPPWHDFAVAMHADQSLRVHVPNHELPNDGTARTVVILYLSGEDLAGGEIEIYEHFSLAEFVFRHTFNLALDRCSRSKPELRRSCAAQMVDSQLENITFGRFRPRTGRLLQFEGVLSHAVRRPKKLASNSDAVRVALVLEQFAYPPEVIAKIPTAWAECQGRPCFVDPKLTQEFVSSQGLPQRWG